MSKSPSPLSVQAKINKIAPAAKEVGLGDILNDLITAQNAAIAQLGNACMTKAGLAIHGSASALAKSVNPIAALVAGVPIRKVASDMPALAGTLATAKSAAWAFYIDGTATLSTSAKTADAASHDAALKLLAAPPAGKALIGFLVIDNATGSNFVGGTTALDTGSLTVTYYDVMGPTVFASALTASTVTALTSR